MGKLPLMVLSILMCIALPLVLLFLERAPMFAALKKNLQTRAVSTGVLNYGTLGKILKQLCFIRLVDNDEKRFFRTDEEVVEDSNGFEVIPFQKKRRVDEYLYSTHVGGMAVLLPQFFPHGLAQRKKWPVLAINIQPEDLYGVENGILTHRDRRGLDWERKAEVAVVSDNDILFYSAAGLRLHGGKRRFAKGVQDDFRIYFRKDYGVESLPPGSGLDLSEPVRTLVVKTTGWPAGQPMNTPLAFDISRKIGCLVPETTLAEIYLNGVSVGMAYLTGHLSRRQWGQYFGDDEYVFYKYKGEYTARDEKIYHNRFWDVATDRKDFSLKKVAESIDIDNFSRHIFSWVFNGTTDACQGVGILDTTDHEAKLRWINWDMDHSFFDLKAQDSGLTRKNWEQEGLALVYTQPHYCDREILFSRLITESSEYREFFASLVTEILNHRLTEGFLLERVNYYQEMLADYGQPHDAYIAMLTEYMRNRSRFLQREMREQLHFHGPFRCEVQIPTGRSMLIDGYKYENNYRGSYFEGQTIILETTGKNRDNFSHWLVNGQRISTSRLQHIVNKQTIIEAVYVTN